ncbi:MAG: DUF4159 domain-containing protein [Planctomycetaceae bacterium]|nr:DUF4159 domain-containing protein [Planctomycetaceae bacterium]
MRNYNHFLKMFCISAAVVGFSFALCASLAAENKRRGIVECANLIYAKNKSSVCFSPEFLKQIEKETNISTSSKFSKVNMESVELYQYPFSVMTGEGDFSLSEIQRSNLRTYLMNGGFIVASAGCSSEEWAKSFRQEIASIFPDVKLQKIDFSHPIFHTVHDINGLDRTKSSGQATLEGLEIDGKIVLIFSSDGLNDSSKAGGNCCCCGGNEIRNARQINVNLLAYTLTH